MMDTNKLFDILNKDIKSGQERLKLNELKQNFKLVSFELGYLEALNTIKFKIKEELKLTN
tara:strand:- start:338 stop:517 length:180 start_codon:yes stop_codon:yes gene_type:complete